MFLVEDRRVKRARRAIGRTAARIIAGELPYLDGARVLLRLRAEADLPEDPDFNIFVLIESETDYLPVGTQRPYWAEAALKLKDADIRRAEEWARGTARADVELLARRFAAEAQPVSTVEILMRKMLGRACGQECVTWAIGMLEQGYESPSLPILAGLTPPLNHFEVAQLRDRALQEIRPAELKIDDPINAYVAEIAFDAIYDIGSLREVFARVTQLAIELGYPADLQPFYNLHFAADDLRHSDVQWYWEGANRENIEQLMLQEAQRFVARYAG
jgi:hypothetical protein